jgi:hypothetical protein
MFHVTILPVSGGVDREGPKIIYLRRLLGEAGDGGLYGANWTTDTGGTVTNAEVPKGPANPSDNLVINSGTPGGGGASGSLNLGTESLTITGGALKFASTFGIQDNSSPPSSAGPFAIINASGGSITATFLYDIHLALSNNATVQVSSSINDSTVNFLSTTSQFNFSNLSATGAQGDLSQFLVNGEPASVGSDPAVAEPGDNLVITSTGTNSSLVQAVPEPGAASLLIAIFTATCVKRRKCLEMKA